MNMPVPSARIPAASAEPDSFREGMIAEMPNLRAFAISLSGNVDKADDLVQETLLKAWSNAESFEAGTNLRAWLFTILRNTYFSLYRRRGREVQDSDGLYANRIATAAPQESAVEMQEFRVALTKLSEEHREALLLVGASGFSYEEAAEVCGVAVGTVKSRVNRARARLAELLGIEGAKDIGAGPLSDSVVKRYDGGVLG
jgi:RNA polymerase sigma-70 factor (ECF subfamily)